jgi:tetratricopeptide (TPR) repeat protein
MNSYHVDLVGKAEYLWNQYLYTESGAANELAWALSTAGGSYGQRGEHDAAIESCELAVRVLRDRIDQGTGTQQDESDLPLLLSNLAGAHGDGHHPAECLTAWSEAVEQQRRVHAACSLEDDDWVLASMLDGYADAALDLGFESEALASLREAEELLAVVLKRRPVFAKDLMDQVEVTRMRLPAQSA